MSRPLALGLGAAATYGLGFIFENVVASAQATTSRTLDSTPALLAPIAGWLLIALAIAALAWLLLDWAHGDRAAGVGLVVFGGVAWLLPWLYYAPVVGGFLPNWVDRLIGRVEFIPITGAFLLVLGPVGLVRLSPGMLRRVEHWPRSSRRGGRRSAR